MLFCLLFAAAPIVKKASDLSYKTILNGKGKASVVLEQPTFAFDLLQGEAGAEVVTHTHAGSAEILYVLEGEAVTVVGDTTVTLVAGDTIVIPADTPHSAKFTKKTRVVQLYSPPGPQERFK